MPAAVARNAPQTRARLLLAARELFTAQGYINVGIRDVAAAAGVNLALVIRYFGSKLALFEEALTAEVEAPSLWQTGLADFGRDVATIMLGVRSRASHPLPMLLFALADPAARAVALRVIEDKVLAPLAGQLAGADREARAAQILALTAGLAVYRDFVPLAAFAGEADPSARRWFETSLQAIVDGTAA